jgi:transcriptional regulator with XRE-family HTH domain
MPAQTARLANPPVQVEIALRQLGADLRTARVRRDITLAEVAAKLGLTRQVIARAEQGHPTTAISVYVALMWMFGFVERFAEVADPAKDLEALALLKARDPSKATRSRGLDNDF